MYERLNNFYTQIAETDHKKYPCTSLAVNNTFPTYKGNVPYTTEEFFQTRQKGASTPLRQNQTCVTSIQHIPEDNFASFKETKNLLPVLETKFNLREICKQSALLEDHLEHE